MKKLAIIGDSNAVLRHGYAAIIKEKIQTDCDVYALGSSTSLFAIFAILEHDIVNNYEYVIISHTINETSNINECWLNEETIISYLAFIINKFSKSLSELMFLLLPYIEYPIYKSISYIYRAMSQLYDIRLIDIESNFRLVDDNIFAADFAHSPQFYQDYISNVILDNLYTKHINKTAPPPPIEFTLFDLKPLAANMRFSERKTSLLGRKVVELTANNIIYLPEEKYLAGIFYWLSDTTPYLVIENSYFSIFKNLNIVYNKAFLCRDIGWSIFDGLKGCAISLKYDHKAMINERTAYEIHKKLKPQSKIDIAAILLCDQPPVAYGFKLAKSIRKLLNKSKEDLLSIYMDNKNISFNCVSDGFNDIVNDPDLYKIIINTRVDLTDRYLRPHQKDIPNLILWAWTHGRKEQGYTEEQTIHLSNGLKKLYHMRHPKASIPNYNMLVHSLWLEREDLHQYCPDTSAGQIAIMNWFERHGIREYNLGEIVKG